MQLEKSQEDRIRRTARTRGYHVRKSRRSVSADNFGDYMLVDLAHNVVALGPRYDASLDDIEAFLAVQD
jgi:hypothetical protein